MFDQVKARVFELLKGDSSGHGLDHVIRVFDLAMKFADAEEDGKGPVDKVVVGLAALLHDVDDYKIFGKVYSENLINAKAVMDALDVDEKTRKKVLDIIGNMGFSKYLTGVRPISLEGKIVSDADMCDAIGASGIIRSVVYAVSSKGNGIIFDKDVFPNVAITVEEYSGNGTKTTHDTDSAINHFFEKMLKLRNLMMTKAGRQESEERQRIMVDFLRHFFKEENVPVWEQFLEDFLDLHTG
ncbi:MAG: HD domain-containing protein [Lachnospiraceae bacterium]|nr:HD domain-containing protein [Lachnospiraceae bacterium]